MSSALPVAHLCGRWMTPHRAIGASIDHGQMIGSTFKVIASGADERQTCGDAGGSVSPFLWRPPDGGSSRRYVRGAVERVAGTPCGGGHLVDGAGSAQPPRPRSVAP